MDSNTFNPSGQGDDNTIPPNQTMTPTASTRPISAVTSTTSTGPAPVASAEQATAMSTDPIAPVPTSTESATSETVSPDTSSSTEKPKGGSSKKALMILGSCLIAVAIIIVVVFLVPFGEKTLWQMITGGNNGGGIGGNGGGNSDNVVNTGDYTYTANFDLEYQPSGYFYDGLLRAKNSDGGTVYLDTAGKLAFELNSQYSSAGHFADGLMPVMCGGTMDMADGGTNQNEVRDVTLKDYLYGYVDKTGELVIPCQYSMAEEFMNGYAAVAIEKEDTTSSYYATNNYWGVIDTSGNLVVDYIYDLIDYESGTFLNQVFQATLDNGEDYIEGCFDFSGNMIREYDWKSHVECAADPQAEEEKNLASTFEEKLGGQYRVNDFSEGLAAVYSSSPMEYYFIDTNGEKVWSLDMNKAVDVDEEEYHEGLFLAFMWVGDDEYPGAQEMERILRDSEINEALLYKNTGAVYYDHNGNPVFIYRYARDIENE